MDFIAPMLLFIVAVLTVGSIFRSHFVNRRLRENARAYAEIQGRLIDKFGDADAVVRYLESDGGQKLLAGSNSGRGGPHTRILDALQTGVIAFLGGIGLMAASHVSDPKVAEVMNARGKIAMLLGVGFAVSAVISHGMLKSWGLLGAAGAKDAEGDGSE